MLAVGHPGEKLLLVLLQCHCPVGLLSDKGKYFSPSFSPSFPGASRLAERRHYLPPFPSTGECVSWMSFVKMT